MKNNWILKEINEDLFKSLKNEVPLTDTALKILIKRGYNTKDTINQFLNPSLTHLYDPFLMLNMEKACKKILETISANHKIIVYGDYDVDGTTSVAMAFSFLQEIGANVEFYIPDRYSEGYGISEKSIRYFSDNGFKLILALDCGTRDLKNIKLASILGIETIVCDHHEPGDELPEAFAILNPKQKACTYPFKELSGCGVGFKLLQALSVTLNLDAKQYFKYLDLVAVSTCCDIVPLIDENRVLVAFGLKKLLNKPIAGLEAISKLSNINNNKITVTDVVFGIGPRINAAGRIAHANEALKVLIGNDSECLKKDSEILNSINEQRKEIDNNISIEALEMISQASSDDRLAFSTVLFNENWHKGIVGIVASRCIEVYYKPTIILTQSEDGIAVGSARSIPGFNLYNALCECSDLMLRFGGHEHAAGLSLKICDIEIFQNRFETIASKYLTELDLIPKIKIDEELPVELITENFFNEISRFEPFGPKNMQPIFFCRDAKVLSYDILKEKHLKLYLKQKKGQNISAIGFNLAHEFEKISYKESISLVYSIQKDFFCEGLSLRIRDFS